MAITEVVQGCGAWELQWKQRPPASIFDALKGIPTLLVFPATVNAETLQDSDRASALFEGVMTVVSTGGVSGWEASWLLQKPDGDGPPWTTTGYGSTVTNITTLADDYWFFTSPHVGTGITKGTVMGAVTSFTDNGPMIRDGSLGIYDARAYFDYLVDQITEAESATASWRLNPGLTLDMNDRDTMFRQNEVVITTNPVKGHGGAAINVPADEVRSARSHESQVYAGRYIKNDGTFFGGSTVVPTVASPGGDSLNIYTMVLLDATDLEQPGILDRVLDGKIARVTCDVTLSAVSNRDIISPGDLVYAHDPYGFAFDDSISITHFGQTIHPIQQWVMDVAWSPRLGQSVVARVSDGIDEANTITYVDLTPYVVLTAKDNMRVTLSDKWVPPYLRSGADTDRLSALRGPWRRYQPPVAPTYSYSMNSTGYTHASVPPGYTGSINIHGTGPI